jgi:hypothetical protein
MVQNNMPENPSSIKQSEPMRPVRERSLLGQVFSILVWMGFGIFGFVLIGAWGAEYNRKMAMIERGEVKPQTLYVVEVLDQSRFQHDKGKWKVSLGENQKERKTDRWDNNVDDLHIGSTVTAYQFGDSYLIPRFDRDGSNRIRWTFLAIGFLPLLIIGGKLLFKALRRRSLREFPQPIPAAKAFSLPSKSFDRVPDDSQLVCLLGNSSDRVEAVEEAELLTVRPTLIPKKYIVPWMIIVLVLITFMMCIMQWGPENRFHSIFFWFFLVSGWFVALPVTLGLFAAVNHSQAKKGDCFKIDMARRTLELCRLGRTLKAGEIIAIILLTRWYRHAGEWNQTYQTGVLVRAQENRVELYPAVCELGENVPSSKKSRWAEQLASIFQVPVRRIELSRSESRALNDC